jgi:amidohydrolase
VINDPTLTAAALDTLRKVVGAEQVREISLQTTAEDFSFYGQQMPAFFFWMGVTPRSQDAEVAPFNHSPEFSLDESALRFGVHALIAVALQTLQKTELPP